MGEVPPFTHRLLELADGIKIPVTKEMREQLREINVFNHPKNIEHIIATNKLILWFRPAEY